ncbi:cytosolic 5'-nucleotidase 1A-like [Cololabis saira]|uniref:cytosolic 5'-nucleotidase 1A-like n=1 Tax=Cololabis saira TaxID=129043 RepID=UPI002AD4155B|nr:cytosolic 5'-nucleotidase 1A-like [Cololabis saira]
MDRGEETPVTIAMSSDLVFVRNQQSNSVRHGPLFSFIRALKAVNGHLLEYYPESEELFRVLLIGDNSSGSLTSTIRDNALEEPITVLSVSEEYLLRELKRNGTQLYLSTEKSKVQDALGKGITAVHVQIPKPMKEVSETELRVAFDGDAVIFSNESELVYSKDGFQAFIEHERKHAEDPMKEGPLTEFLKSLEKLKKKLRHKDQGNNMICTYLVTSRSPCCPEYRARNTLQSWGLEMDEAVFLAGAGKGPTLQRIKPHIFFDDQESHVKAALAVGRMACQVFNN